jgi:mannose-6-phosphate isomerase-like protein (cupin superfamily)
MSTDIETARWPVAIDLATTPRTDGAFERVGGTWSGGVSSQIASVDGFSLWCSRVHMAVGSTLGWTAGHGDEVLWIESGALEIADTKLGAGMVAIVEFGAVGELRAIEDAVVLHLGPIDPSQPEDGMNGPPSRPGGRFHVIGKAGRFVLNDPARLTRFFADSTCDGCRPTIFYTERTERYVSASHTHTQDEIIFVLRGDVRSGRLRLRPGMILMVPAMLPYGFRTDDDGFAFLNYRRDASVHRLSKGGQEQIENSGALELEPSGDEWIDLETIA